MFDLEYNQWRALYSLYKYKNSLNKETEEVLYTELYWLVSDAINVALKNGQNDRVKQYLSIPEIVAMKRYCNQIKANKISKHLILTRNAAMLKAFYRILDKCGK